MCETQNISYIWTIVLMSNFGGNSCSGVCDAFPQSEEIAKEKTRCEFSFLSKQNISYAKIKILFPPCHKHRVFHEFFKPSVVIYILFWVKKCYNDNNLNIILEMEIPTSRKTVSVRKIVSVLCTHWSASRQFVFSCHRNKEVDTFSPFLRPLILRHFSFKAPYVITALQNLRQTIFV